MSNRQRIKMPRSILFLLFAQCFFCCFANDYVHQCEWQSQNDAFFDLRKMMKLNGEVRKLYLVNFF